MLWAYEVLPCHTVVTWGCLTVAGDVILCEASKGNTQEEIEMTTPLAVVKLEDEKYPGNGGVVIALVSSLSEYYEYRDRDGCMPSNLRLCRCYDGVQVGHRVMSPP